MPRRMSARQLGYEEGLKDGRARSRSPQKPGDELIKSAEGIAEKVGGYKSGINSLDWPYRSVKFTRHKDGVTVDVRTDGRVQVAFGQAFGLLRRSYFPIKAQQLDEIFRNPEVEVSMHSRTMFCQDFKKHPAREGVW
eukprot:CAMPEP_0177156322 /NCGR_PEP_ID=MMETSP0367-20130122/2666_1 /TAXON_ID=447022 ORGANISM="Scrippsiella hangoei-like, Strain SHHI-4" /NCGR_SAMPLE_ID=MMETSP0367 /ASSEMBLY_ACC=CAM_ASM_000362 /LENGTH=136 /DNA_ID=CAMNT_0018601771 /DNA_START=68 /DNA_END=475 /DNA_ORIENTATION=-